MATLLRRGSAPAPAGGRASALLGDVIAGLTLAAVAIPEQMATARLGGFPPQVGFFAFITATAAFCVFGSNRFISVGADSTITPVFAGALALLAVAGSPHYAAFAAALAVMVGAMVIVAGVLRLGWIADLLSVPVTIGFLAGIAVHIIASQLPGALGVASGEGGSGILARLSALVRAAPQTNAYALAISAGVLAVTALCHKISARLPGPLVAMVAATVAVVAWRLEARGVKVIGAVAAGFPAPGTPHVGPVDVIRLAPLAFLIALIVMVQTAATSRAFPSNPDKSPDLDRDFIGAGMGGLIAGLFSAFPVNASPPRTAVVVESGGRSKFAGVLAAVAVALVLLAGAGLLTHVPQAALSGVLLFVALRIIRVGQASEVARTSPVEFLLILATAASIIFLPIATGVAVGIGLSVMHGVWSSARPRLRRLRRLPGTTVWWSVADGAEGEETPGVLVLGCQAPLSFVNAYAFRAQALAALSGDPQPHLVVIEAAGMVDIDFTGAQVFKTVVEECRKVGAELALARLESDEAQKALARFGLAAEIGADHIFPSVEAAVTALAPKSASVTS